MVFTIFFLCGCSGLFIGSGSGEKGRGVSLSAVQVFVNGFGQKKGSSLVGLFDSDAVIEIKGLGVVAQGKKELIDLFAYAQAVRSRLNSFDFRTEQETVFCRLIEQNQVYDLSGLGSVSYDAWFVFEKRRVFRLIIRPDAGSGALMIRQGLGFFKWLKENEPNAVSELMPDGKFRFSAENGRKLLELVARWCGRKQ